ASPCRAVKPRGGATYRRRSPMKSLFLVLGLVLVMPALAGSQGDRGPPADILAVRNIEVTFHTAGSVLPEKSADLMIGIYADDAVPTDTAHDNKVYTGKAEVRRYWADVSGPFCPSVTGSATRARCACMRRSRATKRRSTSSACGWTWTTTRSAPTPSPT
ncbi:MAG: hypothetical protein ACRD3Q_06145, partial [Terriglobales bacterium]